SIDPGAESQSEQGRAPSQAAKPAAAGAEIRASAETPRVGAAGAHGAMDSVRVSVGKLDTLLAQAGELTVTGIRIGQRLEELHGLKRDLNNWRREWRAYRAPGANLRRVAGRPTGADGLPARDREAL